jgi:hypothetical protein
MRLLFVLLLFFVYSIAYSQTYKRIPVTALMPSYTQAQEDSLALTIPASVRYVHIWNSTLLAIRIWNGSIFENIPASPQPPLTVFPFGYDIGSGGSVTQLTSKSTGVTLNKPCGRITMNSSAMLPNAEVAFTLTNSMISSSDMVMVAVQSIGTPGSYLVSVGAISNGSCSITVNNCSMSNLSQAVVLNFIVIKSAFN